jgi:hypothetical protein
VNGRPREGSAATRFMLSRKASTYLLACSLPQ